MAHPSKSGNPNDFILPDLGEGVHEAELIKWRVEVGQTVAEHDILAEMETDKALVEVPSPRPGVISVLHGKPGEILKVGNPLVSYEGPAGSASAPAAASTSAAHAAASNGTHSKSAASSSSGCDMGAQIAAGADHAEEAREDAGTVVGAMNATAAGVTARAGGALATPAVRRLARDLGVNIDSVPGTGIGGRVLEKDVRSVAAGSTATRAPAAVAAPARAPASARTVELAAPAPSSSRSAAPAPRAATPIPPGQETVRIPFRGVRRTIANRLRESINQAVHFTVMDEADATAMDALRRKLAAASGEKLSFLPFVASAACRVLSMNEFRALNATVDEKPSDPSFEASIVQHRGVHLGIATDTDSGLMVPVVRDCDALGVLEVSRHILHVAASARDRSAPREMLAGSTFTISNVGSHAGRFATPVINYPEVGILAVGRAREGMVVSKGMFRVGQLLPMSLACDHRVVDGATAALALAKIIELLQNPEVLLGPARS